MLYGSVDGNRRNKDQARFQAIRGVSVVHRPARANTFGSDGILQLTPEPGVTLLEVFLLTQAEFFYGDEWWEEGKK
jgi:hypothetical protein